MPPTLDQTLSLPCDANTPIAWLTLALRAFTDAEELLQRGTWFANRALYDNRQFEKDPNRDGAPTGGRINGAFFDHPTRELLWQGSENERDRGLLIARGEDREPDPRGEDRHGPIQAFSRTAPRTKGLPLPQKNGVRISHVYVDQSPSELAYQRFVQALGLRPLTHVFAVRTRHGEGGAYFFPMTWGKEEGLYFVVEIDARYGDLSHFFFQGDPVQFGVIETRGPRSHEVDDYFANPRAWGPKACPHEIPITYDLHVIPHWTQPQPIELRDVQFAHTALLDLPDSTRCSPYLNRGGA